MYTQNEIKGFINTAESLKKYRRADLLDETGKSILDELYVDLLPNNVILNKCLLDNTTFLIGRKGTGKSTIFLKMENEFRRRKNYIPCYLDVKTIYESSQAQAANFNYLSKYLEEKNLEKYLMSRHFIQSVLLTLYKEIDKQRVTLFDHISRTIIGNSNEEVKKKIQNLYNKVNNNEQLKEIEIPVLQQKTIKNNKLNKTQIKKRKDGQCILDVFNLVAITQEENGIENEKQKLIDEEYTDILLKVFEIKNIIQELKDILHLMRVNKLVIMLDDMSEINGDALKLFVDTIVAPLNNWSDEFIKFKIAFYPGRVHYGLIDPGKIDVINLDFYNLYSEFDANKMEENAIDFTKRLLENRFGYYSVGIEKYFDERLIESDLYELFFKVSMNVPRIIGYILSYLYQSVIVYNKKIGRQDIENAAEKYYEEKIDAFFKSSTYCLLTIEEKKDIQQLKKLRDVIVNRAKELKSQILKGELKGKLYLKNKPYTSHFHILQENDKYLDSLELNHFITKYEEKVNRDGKMVNVYCLNYGLAKKNNIIWGRESGSEFRKYFIERPFNYTNLILEQIKEVKVIRCTNAKCGRVFSEADLEGLKFTGFKCPDCYNDVKIDSVIDLDVEKELQEINKLPLLNKEELSIILELNNKNNYSTAKEIAEEVDMNSYRVAKICKKLDEEKGIVKRKMTVTPYEYCVSEKGKEYIVK